ncbi:MAG TPA: NAD(P)-dependent oxidoreductase [Burkholderiales bacterium]|nr:NAD(P)-dependent oxidoreductase [Burkholderiales bacterium]
MKVFVTGATGVVGRRAVPLLVRAGHRVTAVARSADKAKRLERLGVLPVGVDLFDRRALREALPGHDVVINLATHIPHSTARLLLPGAWRENDRIRRVGSANLVDAALAAGVQRFIQESFAPVYPDCGDAWIDETTALEPARFNASITDAETAAQRFGDRGRIDIVLRFAAFYGPDAYQTRDMIKAVRRGWAPVPGRPDAFFSSISHDDAASAVVAALKLPRGIYNVVDDEPLPRREVGATLAAALGVRPPRALPAWFIRLTGSLGELMSRSQRISNRKLRNASAWVPKYPSLREGWREVLQALQQPVASSDDGRDAFGLSDG